MEKWKADIEKEFEDCLKKFPELKNYELIIEEIEDKLVGGVGKRLDEGEEEEVVVLFVPAQLRDLPIALRPIIFHELSHRIDRENPDKVFFERADDWSKEMWRKLQAVNGLGCIVEKNVE